MRLFAAIGSVIVDTSVPRHAHRLARPPPRGCGRPAGAGGRTSSRTGARPCPRGYWRPRAASNAGVWRFPERAWIGTRRPAGVAPKALFYLSDPSTLPYASSMPAGALSGGETSRSAMGRDDPVAEAVFAALGRSLPGPRRA